MHNIIQNLDEKVGGRVTLHVSHPNIIGASKYSGILQQITNDAAIVYDADRNISLPINLKYIFKVE